MDNRARHRRGNGQLVSARNWIFTLWDTDAISHLMRYNPQTDDWQLIPGVRYLIYQMEQAPLGDQQNEYGGLHIQGYVELDQRMTLPQVQALFGWDMMEPDILDIPH
jgi:hypothetical protein